MFVDLTGGVTASLGIRVTPEGDGVGEEEKRKRERVEGGWLWRVRDGRRGMGGGKEGGGQCSKLGGKLVVGRLWGKFGCRFCPVLNFQFKFLEMR